MNWYSVVLLDGLPNSSSTEQQKNYSHLTRQLADTLTSFLFLSF